MKETSAPIRTPMLAAILLVSFLVGIGAVYVTRGGGDNTPVQEDGKAVLKRLAKPASGTPLTRREPLARGDMAAFVFSRTPAKVADVAFTDEMGKKHSLAAFKGKLILLNLWATWCRPCRKEMPDLDNLQGKLGSERFEVVALAVDQGGVKGAKAFLDKVGVKHLRVFVDETARAGSALKVVGMPTTLLIDGEGRELGRLTGPAKWDSGDAIALVKEMIARAGKGR